MKLLVRNLAVATTEEKIKNLFNEYGVVQSCNLVLDKITGKSKGFAFVEMPKVGEAKAAIKNLNSYKLAGNLIRVKKAEAKQEETDKTIKSVKEKTLGTIKKEITVPAGLKNNTDNTLNIYGEIKKSDDKF